MTIQEVHANRKIRCILFDFGDTLWTRNPDTYATAELHAELRAMQTLRNYINLQHFPDANLKHFAHRLQKQIHSESRRRMREKPGYEPDYADCVLVALEHLGLPRLDHNAANAILEALRVRIPESRMLFPDTLSTLAALQERGYILGVVTNRGYGGAPFREDMHQLGFDRFFDLDAMAVSVDLGLRKPHPDIFHYALNKLSVAPSEAAMVGDSLYADVRGAQKLDILSVWRPKQSLYEEAGVALAKPLAGTQDTAAEPPADPGVDLPNNGEEEIPDTDDTVFLEKADLVRYALQHRKREHYELGNEINPDHIIYSLSELLTLF